MIKFKAWKNTRIKLNEIFFEFVVRNLQIRGILFSIIRKDGTVL